MATTTKKTSTSKKTARRTSTRPKAESSNKVDYYPNRVPILAAALGASILVLITAITTTNW